jgi:dolichyl-phosphate beta-glucosyltransferase
MDVSVIIPVLDGEDYIERSVEDLIAFLSRCGLGFEVIVVDDGSRDRTGSILESLRGECVRIVSLEKNQGKYGALKAGMAQARGSCRMFTDADIPYELEAIPYIVHLVNERAFHVVVGDRTLPGSEYTMHVPWTRSLATRVFSLFVTMFVTGGLFDTQCGLKGFRADVADALFPLLQDAGFSGDVELLYVALKYNLAIRRIPVRLKRSAPSSVRLFAHAVRMLARISQLRRSWKLGIYASPVLERLSRQTYLDREAGSGL